MDDDSPSSDNNSSPDSSQPSGLQKFWQELRRRHVVRVAIVYAVVGWLVIQVANATFSDFGIPVWAYRFLTQMPASIPDDKLLPGKLKSKLDAAIASGDRNQIRPLMQEVRAWAETQGIELLAGGRGEPPG